MKEYIRLPQSEDARNLRFPDERLGDTYDLNNIIIRSGIVPNHNAYYNLHTRHLMMIAKGTTDKYKSLHIGNKNDGLPAVLITGENAVEPPDFVNVISMDDAEKIGEKLLENMGNYNLHVTDGSVGSHMSSDVVTRVISTDPTASLFLKHQLNKVSGSNVLKVEPTILIYHDPGYNELPIKIKKSNNKGGYAFFNITSGKKVFSELDPRRVLLMSEEQKLHMQNSVKATVCLFGNISNTVLLSTIISISNFFLESKGATLVNAHTLYKNGKSYLVFDNQLGLHPNHFSAGYSILNKGGIVQAFSGITHNNFNQARKRGDIVEKRDNQYLITETLPIQTRVVPKPTSIIIVERGKITAKTDEEKKTTIKSTLIKLSKRNRSSHILLKIYRFIPRTKKGHSNQRNLRNKYIGDRSIN